HQRRAPRRRREGVGARLGQRRWAGRADRRRGARLRRGGGDRQGRVVGRDRHARAGACARRAAHHRHPAGRGRAADRRISLHCAAQREAAMISVLLADDHSVVLSGLKAMLSAEADVRVIGEATDGLEVVPMVEQHKPDVLVLDLMMPGLNGLEVARQLEKRVPSTRVVILSMHANEAYVVEALRAGASGYVLKQSPGNEVGQAIRAVMSGKRYLSPPLSDEVLRRFEERMNAAALDPYDTLS